MLSSDSFLVTFSQQVDFQKHVFRLHETILFEVREGLASRLFREIFEHAFYVNSFYDFDAFETAQGRFQSPIGSFWDHFGHLALLHVPGRSPDVQKCDFGCLRGPKVVHFWYSLDTHQWKSYRLFNSLIGLSNRQENTCFIVVVTITSIITVQESL